MGSSCFTTPIYTIERAGRAFSSLHIWVQVASHLPYIHKKRSGWAIWFPAHTWLGRVSSCTSLLRWRVMGNILPILPNGTCFTSSIVGGAPRVPLREEHTWLGRVTNPYKRPLIFLFLCKIRFYTTGEPHLPFFYLKMIFFSDFGVLKCRFLH